MQLIADGLLIAAALCAAIYCHVLAGRLRRLRDMDGGVGAAIAALSSQVEEMRAALEAARAASGESAETLARTTARAEMAAGRLELLLASVHDRDGARPAFAEARRSGRAAPASDLRGSESQGQPKAAAPEAARSEALHAALAALKREAEA
jgi:hypothetical protein